MEGPEIIFAEATIDNGKFGNRTIVSRPAGWPSRLTAQLSPTSTTTR
jgi:hypothetical protein